MGKKKKKRPTRFEPLALGGMKARRKLLGLSQAELAEALGVSDATVGRCENGKQNWDQELLQEAAAALRCHWLELLPLDKERDIFRSVVKLAIAS